MTRAFAPRLALALTVFAAMSAAAMAFWTSSGTGAAAATAASFSSASVSVPATTAGSVVVSWTQQAALVPTSPASSQITYTVERKLESGTYAPVTSGGCAGTLTYGTQSCTDTVVQNGSYRYRVVARLQSWSATSAESAVVVAMVDGSAPAVQSINRADTSPTNAGTVRWTVTFSEPVTGVNSGDFQLPHGDGLAGGSITSVSGSGTSYTVSASSGSGAGTLGLNLVDDDSVIDTAGNNLGGAGADNGDFTGQLYSVDRAPPVVQSINRTATSPTNASSVSWTVTFSEPVTFASAAPLLLVRTGGLTGGTITSTTGSGASYTVTASTGSGSGTLGLNVVDDDSIVDALGNPLGGTGAGDGNFTGQTYTLDRSGPVLTALQMNDVNANGKVDRITATFDETLAGSTATDAWTLTNTPSGGSLGGVATSGTTATLTLDEGAGAADTAVGSFRVALSGSATGIRDSLGNQGSFAATAPVDKAGPVPVTVTDGSGLTDGRIETGDSFITTFSEAIASGVPAAPAITEARPSSGNATLSISGITDGALNLGSADYLLSANSTAVFAGSSSLSNANKTVTIAVGGCESGCLAVGVGTGTTMVYVPATGLLDSAGNSAAGSRATDFRVF